MRQGMTRATLGVSGTILVFIGGSLLFDTQAFLAMNGAQIGTDPNVLSEVRAPAGLLVITGALMLAGSARYRFADAGMIAGGVVYGSFGLSRMISIMMDGLPSQALIVATLIELGVAVILFTLWKTNSPALTGRRIA